MAERSVLNLIERTFQFLSLHTGPCACIPDGHGWRHAALAWRLSEELGLRQAQQRRLPSIMRIELDACSCISYLHDHNVLPVRR
jgi:hypothetical protein